MEGVRVTHLTLATDGGVKVVGDVGQEGGLTLRVRKQRLLRVDAARRVDVQLGFMSGENTNKSTILNECVESAC